MKRKVVGITLILIGAMILGNVFYGRYKAYREQQDMKEYFEKSIAEVDKKLNKGEDKKPSVNGEENLKGVIGILSIPKIDLNVAIGEGVDLKTLKYAVGHFPGTAMPGEKGNFCLAGHRSYTYSEYFNRLNEVKVGDEIIIKAKSGTFKYRVNEIKVVLPSEVSVLNDTKDETMTLVTCTPIRIASHRLIVKGILEK